MTVSIHISSEAAALGQKCVGLLRTPYAHVAALVGAARHPKSELIIRPRACMDDRTVVFFDRLIEQSDPRRQPADDLARQAQIFAGRWLALRRLHLGLTSAQMVERTGMVASTLLLLEAGLADDALVPKQAWEQLIEALTDGAPPAVQVEAVVAMALGRPNPLDQQLLAQVMTDLGQTFRDDPEVDRSVPLLKSALTRAREMPQAVLARGMHIERPRHKLLMALGILVSLLAFWYYKGDPPQLALSVLQILSHRSTELKASATLVVPTGSVALSRHLLRR